jgi:hypothetical protein
LEAVKVAPILLWVLQPQIGMAVLVVVVSEFKTGEPQCLVAQELRVREMTVETAGAIRRQATQVAVAGLEPQVQTVLHPLQVGAVTAVLALQLIQL